MLKQFKMRGYKNFQNELVIHFDQVAGYQFSNDCIYNNLISKMLIYGRNATGKTNLGRAIMDIRKIFLSPRILNNDISLLNAFAEDDTIFFSYTFVFDKDELTYCYERNSQNDLKCEELIVNGISIFKCDFINLKFNFDNLKFIHAETATTARYIQSIDNNDDEMETQFKLPFIRWLLNNVAFSNQSIMIELNRFVIEMRMLTVSTGRERFYFHHPRSTFNRLVEQDPQYINELENFLNMMGVECHLALRKLPDNSNQLYFDCGRLVPFFENASSGTLALFDLYMKIILPAKDASFIYLDEFDAFYHYEMAEQLIKFIKKRYTKCQVILTSHNTNLITNKIMRPDCLFVLSRKGVLSSLCSATSRELREGHNLEKMYISGEFEAYE